MGAGPPLPTQAAGTSKGAGFFHGASCRARHKQHGREQSRAHFVANLRVKLKWSLLFWNLDHFDITFPLRVVLLAPRFLPLFRMLDKLSGFDWQVCAAGR